MTSVIFSLLLIFCLSFLSNARDVHSWPIFGLFLWPVWTVRPGLMMKGCAALLARQELVKKMFANPPDTPGIRVHWNRMEHACLCMPMHSRPYRDDQRCTTIHCSADRTTVNTWSKHVFKDAICAIDRNCILARTVQGQFLCSFVIDESLTSRREVKAPKQKALAGQIVATERRTQLCGYRGASCALKRNDVYYRERYIYIYTLTYYHYTYVICIL